MTQMTATEFYRKRQAEIDDAASSQYCPGCGAEYLGHAGAYACGYPLADCGVMLAEAEASCEFDALKAEGEALGELLEQFVADGCPAEDAAALDALEHELEAKLDAFFPSPAEAPRPWGGRSLFKAARSDDAEILF
jgi:hypothetical protein